MKTVASELGQLTGTFFADVIGFTAFSVHTPATELVSLLNDLFSRFDSASQNGQATSREYWQTGGVVRMAVGKEDVARCGLVLRRSIESQAAGIDGHPVPKWPRCRH